ncbi:MAG: hypothetical protein AB9869_34415 [Verrucomicrobiia bacterium]
MVRAQTASILTALEPAQEQPAARTLGGGLLILTAAVVISRANPGLKLTET